MKNMSLMFLWKIKKVIKSRKIIHFHIFQALAFLQGTGLHHRQSEGIYLWNFKFENSFMSMTNIGYFDSKNLWKHSLRFIVKPGASFVGRDSPADEFLISLYWCS